jgi:DNA-binding MurR/RpiR family transcriptional regulator
MIKICDKLIIENFPLVKACQTGGLIMINLDLSRLNPLELKVYQAIHAYAAEHPNLNITEAAFISECSISKVSKLSKKLGFTNFKQYMDFVYGRTPIEKASSSELERLRKFIDDFDSQLVIDFIDILDNYDKIILFGYGPSYLIAQYFEYKLRIFTNKTVMALTDELSVRSMVDNKTLLVVLTTTGSFKSFQNIFEVAKSKGGEVLVVAEEYNPSLINTCDKMFWLSKFPQPSEFQPHEKTRTAFLIFIEEVIHRLRNPH